MIPIKGTRRLNIRNDVAGGGFFGASRGSRSHQGIDFELGVGELLLSPVQGVITRIGYPYGDELTYRYVEVSVNEYKHRFFYLKTSAVIGTPVLVGAVLGTAQDIVHRYPDRGMTNHIHYEIKFRGSKIDPEEYWS